MSNPPAIALIVEGHGDVQGAPELVRRMTEGHPEWVRVLLPHRVPKNRMIQELPRAVRLQLDRVGPRGGVVVLVDADEDDPVEFADQLTATLDDHHRRRARVVVATKEYEAWFLGGLKSLRRHRSVLDDAHFDGDPEQPRDAKGALRARMNEPYQETIHQAAFSAMVDLEQASGRCPSLVRFSEALDQLLDLTDSS